MRWRSTRIFLEAFEDRIHPGDTLALLAGVLLGQPTLPLVAQGGAAEAGRPSALPTEARPHAAAWTSTGEPVALLPSPAGQDRSRIVWTGEASADLFADPLTAIWDFGNGARSVSEGDQTPLLTLRAPFAQPSDALPGAPTFSDPALNTGSERTSGPLPVFRPLHEQQGQHLLDMAGQMATPAPARPREIVSITWQSVPTQVVAGEWVAQFDTSVGEPVLSSPGIQVKRYLGGAGTFLLETSPTLGHAELVQSLSALPGFQYVEPNLIVQAATIPNDPMYSRQYPLHNTGQTGGQPDADIDAPEAWDLSRGNRNVVVGVLDTGIDYNHPDLAGNVWRNPGEIPGNRIDDDLNGYVDDIHGINCITGTGNPFDDNGHGTHMAGTIAAVGNNGLGVTGVNWTGQIMAVKVFGQNGTGTLDSVLAGINYLSMMRGRGVNVPIINFSGTSSAYSQALKDAIDAGGRVGQLYVAAAGNSGSNNELRPVYPASFDLPNILAVAATDHWDNRASFSNYGARSVDLAAPGVNILSTIPNNGYGYLSGTSAAAAHVTGAAALTWTVAPNRSYWQISDALLAGVDPLRSLSGQVRMGGRLNAFQTLQQVQKLPPLVPAVCDPCAEPRGLLQTAPGTSSGSSSSGGFSEGPIRYYDGTMKLSTTDLSSSGFGTPWGHRRSFANHPGATANSFNGDGWIVTQLPYLRQIAGNEILAVITDGTNVRYFDFNGATYVPRFYVLDKLTVNAAASEFLLTDTTGNRLRFHDYSTSLPVNQRGQLKSITDPAGNVTTVSRLTTGPNVGKVSEVQRSASGNPPVTESFAYTYNAAGLLFTVQQRHGPSPTGPWTIVRQVEYAYYGSAESHGNAGNLRTAIIRDAAGNALSTKYYRYYKPGESNGYLHGLKSVFEGPSYARLQAAFPNPFAATDAQAAPYADYVFKYGAGQAVTEETVAGFGTSTAPNLGRGTFQFLRELSSHPEGYNSWKVKTTETLPDGNQNIVFTNAYGQEMLHVFREVSTGRRWATFHRYDGQGRLLMTAPPSAVIGYDETKADLLNQVGGNYQYLADSTGLIEHFTYYSSGAAAGYFNWSALRRGELGSTVPQRFVIYAPRTVADVTIQVPATETIYRNSNGTGPQTTSYGYTWLSGSLRPQSVSVTRPVVPAAQNGPDTLDSTTSFFDTYGRLIWHKDGDGFLHYTAYDSAAGAIVKTITDVNTTLSGDFTNLPTGWVTPPGGGQHLKTLHEVDRLGRTIGLTDAIGNVSYTVYNDAAHETRTYVGWNSTTNLPTGPTLRAREDWAGSYTESLTMSAVPAVSGGRPTGTEPISSLHTLARDHFNPGGQVIFVDRYLNLSGLNYTANPDLGSENVHFYRTRYGYDARGRQAQATRPTGTIERTEYDGLGRAVRSWVGTTAADQVLVRANVYDKGGIGDSNLTQAIVYPGVGTDTRVTDYSYDWRNRLVATKGGVQTNEGADTQRPISYVELDNLGQVVAREQYDGDGVTIVDSNGDGVPDKPPANLRRARSTYEYDEQDRLFRSRTFSVDQSTGVVSANSLTTNLWYDRRDHVLKTAAPGGLVYKTRYDGAGRAVKTFVSDGGGDVTWAHAGDVVGDIVLRQTETQYDGNGNPLFVTTKLRFHDATATGELTASNSRVTYAAAWFDRADRTLAVVDVGTNGGTPYTRPATVPARSNTVHVTSYAHQAGGWLDTVTDPRGIVRKYAYDNLGRRIRTIDAFTDGIPTASTNRTSETTYDGSDHVVTQTARQPGGGMQQIEHLYSARTATGSGLNSNDLLTAVRYPDKVTGLASELEQVTVTVNALGQTLSKTDRAGTVHEYSYDVLGRRIADAVTGVGAGVDGQVLRLDVAFDTGGRPAVFSSYDAPSGGNVINQVHREFNGLGQLTTEYQSHWGPVDPATTPKVQYVYSEMAGGANHSRLVRMIYPGGRELNYNYAPGLDSNISRLSSLSDSSGTLEVFSYLGLSTAVRRAHPETGVDLTYIKQAGESNGDAGDQYTGLDRFGEVVDQRWLRTSDGTPTDRFRYGYDRNGNPLYRENLVNPDFSELYHSGGAGGGYDLLNRETGFARGQLNATKDGIVGDPSRTQTWDLDAMGNWNAVTTDGTTEGRTHNAHNQIVDVGGIGLAYDANGNLIVDQAGSWLVYDAWDRLTQVYDVGGNLTGYYAYDSLGRRVFETTKDLFYSAAWQVIEELDYGYVPTQYVWSPVYVDALVLRDRDTDWDGVIDERLYVQQDANFNVTALLDTAGNVAERYVYDPYGQATALAPDWTVSGGSFYGWIYLHQGGRLDPATGLYHFRNRDYSPVLGRWIQEDPIGWWGDGINAGNAYAYLDGNPLGRRDPVGLLSLVQDGGLSEQDKKALDQLLDKLKSDDLGERNQATDDLIEKAKKNPEAEKYIDKQLAKSDDSELKMRRGIIQDALHPPPKPPPPPKPRWPWWIVVPGPFGVPIPIPIPFPPPPPIPPVPPPPPKEAIATAWQGVAVGRSALGLSAASVAAECFDDQQRPGRRIPRTAVELAAEQLVPHHVTEPHFGNVQLLAATPTALVTVVIFAVLFACPTLTAGGRAAGFDALAGPTLARLQGLGPMPTAGDLLALRQQLLAGPASA